MELMQSLTRIMSSELSGVVDVWAHFDGEVKLLVAVSFEH